MIGNWIAGIHSFIVCHGRHLWRLVNAFIYDDENIHQQTERYFHCVRCGLRSDGKGYDE